MKQSLSYYRGKYRGHRYNATRRGHIFLLTFEEWLQIWFESGQLDNRGNKKGRYVMARYGDAGPYQVGNVKIISMEQNLIEQWARPETREKVRQSLVGNTYAKGYKHTEEAKRKMLGNKNGIGNKASTGLKASAETRKKLSAARRRMWALRKEQQEGLDGNF